MTMLEAIGAAIGVAEKIFAGLKKLSDVSKKFHDAELQNILADLMINIADLKTELAKSRDENLQLRSQNDDLAKKVDIRSKVEIRDGLYYLAQPVQGYSEGPFCPVCLDHDGAAIGLIRTHMISLGSRTRTPSGWRCGCCKNRFHE